jgi:hypothetical protein
VFERFHFIENYLVEPVSGELFKVAKLPQTRLLGEESKFSHNRYSIQVQQLGAASL